MPTFRYDDPGTVLRGQIYTDYFYGRPNYGETPEIDELEHAIFLALDQPIDVQAEPTTEEGDYRAIPCAWIDHVQLAGNVDIELLREKRGHGMEITGCLFHAHTGHHHAELLTYLRDTKSQAIDDRNIFPGARFSRSGTGLLLGCNGLIATAAHVISGMLGLTIARGLYRSKVEVVHCDLDNDVAILHVEPMGYLREVISKREQLALPIRTWMQPQLGERIYAYGFPLRPVLPHSLNMTEGVVSAEVGLKTERFQISAAIQKGNSGGPVCDINGNLIGVVRSALEPTPQFSPENVNFAVRSRTIADICTQLHVEPNMKERHQPTSPVALAKLMQQLCVEVECWEAVP